MRIERTRPPRGHSLLGAPAAPPPPPLDPETEGLLAALERGEFSPLPDFALHVRAVELSLSPSFDRLLSLAFTNGVDPHPHQLGAAKKVLGQMDGRALLCDETGMGKTIEACIVLDELLLRGLASSVLVLVPPSLVGQWREELREKFRLEFATTEDPGFRPPASWTEEPRLVASLALAKRPEHAREIAKRAFDVIVVDEAHHLRRRETVAWRFVNSLPKRYVLLLTATPVQNDLEELHNLVTLLAPGQLSTLRAFRRAHVSRGDPLLPRDPATLRAALSQVMVRNRRATSDIAFTRRHATTICVPLSTPEAALYARVSDLVREEGRAEKGGISRIALATLQMEMGSTPAAASPTLLRLAEAGGEREARLLELAEAANALGGGAKLPRLLALLSGTAERALVFTRFRATQERLLEALRGEGIDAVPFHGGMRRLERAEAIAAFRDRARVLVSTDAGSEGRNLQFCNVVVNFDLPWNPMKIEQRIGRVSRVGQTRDVHVFNFAAAGTIEEAVLEVLDRKVNLFELVVGEVDVILGNLAEEKDFENVVMDLWVGAEDGAAFRRGLDELGERMLRAKEAYLEARRVEDRLFGEEFATKEAP
ncbi:MAG: SNF2-related protein [Planctomycetes bacterium]|nr:SNF2-related protein [Planctomycetota bacterium]